MNFDATLEAYLHSNTTDFVGRETWIRGFNEQKPLLGVALETWPANNFYGYSEFTVGNTNTLKNGFGSSVFGRNIPMVPPAEIWDLDFNMPYRAFVAAGGDHWSFQLGRDRLNWGAGTSGNLAMSDTLKYHNLARVTTFSDRFKYTFLTSFFPHPMHYYDTVATDKMMARYRGLARLRYKTASTFSCPIVSRGVSLRIRSASLTEASQTE